MRRILLCLAVIVCTAPLSFCQNIDSTLTYGKIPIESKRWYQLSDATYGIGQLFDSVLTENVFTGWGKIINNYDAYYPILPGETVLIDSIRMYDWQGVGTDNPTYLYAIDSNWNRNLIATFWGNRYAVWVGPNPSNPWVYKLDSLVKNIKYLMLHNGSVYPSELQLYGWYKAPSTAAPLVKPNVKLKDMFGVNAFEWQFENASIDAMKVDTNFLKPIKSFSGFRHYMDWNKLENTQGKYTFSPTHNGGWSYDSIYIKCKDAGIEVLADLKTIPSWIESTYPSGQQHYDNIPTQYGNDLSIPASYIDQAKVAFQYAARYGYNTNVNTSLLTVDSSQRWYGDSRNYIKKGMGLIKYIECDNERDKWWEGLSAYQTGRQYAANLSAFYDGHLGTLGNNVGVKTADTSMKVVMCGVALATTDYLRGMIDWCKEFRGFKPDGSVNLCWDIINYHYYSTDAQDNVGSYSSHGVAPELSLTDSIANLFMQAAHTYANDIPVWVTESGYDINPWSSYHVNAVGSRTVLATQADWILRTSLTYARDGIQKLFFYSLYDDNSSSSGNYATSGLLNNDHTRRPSTDYIYQVNNLFGNYHYQQTLNSSPIADEYTLNDSTFMYTVYMPTASNQSASYTLNLGNADSAIIYTPSIASDTMTTTSVKTTAGNVVITATETPVFIKGFGTLSNSSTFRKKAMATYKPQESIAANTAIYPNPANGYVNIKGDNISRVTIVASTGKIVFDKAKMNTNLVTVNGLLKGIYLVQIINANKQIEVQKLIVR